MKDLTGCRFGKWLAVSFSHRNKSMYYWHCQCECGSKKLVSSVHLVYGRSKQCWNCREKERTTHGHTKTAMFGGRCSPTYLTWRSMIQRCNDETTPCYSRYGGLGVKICKRWYKFINFLQDMGERPAGKTLDRKNPFGNYTKKNCRWATRSEQANNKRHERARDNLGRYT